MIHPTSHTPKLLALGPAARRLHVPTRWLRDEAEAGRVPCLKAGNRLLFNLAAVERELLKRANGSHHKGQVNDERSKDGCPAVRAVQ